jgi:succinyl-diaminopimelate desuccinylase
MKVFKKLANDESFPRDRLGLMLVTDEEIGGHNGSKMLLEKGYKSSFLMTGESTDFDIEVAAKGVLWIKLMSEGVSAHGAYLWNGKNAIIPMSQVITELQKLFPSPKNEVWKTTCNIASIVGGSATNRVPDSCELKCDIRYIPEDNPDEIVSKIKKIIPKSISLEVVMKEPYLKTDTKNNLLAKLTQSVVKHHGKKPKFVKKYGASDARFFSEAGIPTTSFGPIGAGLHSDYEWVSLRSLKTYELILYDFLYNI